LKLNWQTDPNDMQMVGQYKDPNKGQYWKASKYIAVSNNYAYVCDNSNHRLIVLNVADPCNPSLVTYLSSTLFGSGGDEPLGIDISGHYAYVGCAQSNKLFVIDISNPSRPIIVGLLKDDIALFSINSISISNGYIYSCGTLSGRLTVCKTSSFEDRRWR
jgi:hypothetical protein